ncbi:MAG: PEGA domain-containing protein [Bacteroidetes bacterium]|nr:MAG: PEGA domain-containing protein [Bacteroidota bacterium]
MKILLCTLYVVLCVCLVDAQDRATISVRSDLDSAKVFMDSMFIGTTPLESASIDTGKHILRVVHANERNWYHPPVIETIRVAAGEHIERTVTIPSYEYAPHIISASWKEAIEHDSLSAIPGLALEGKTVPSATPLYLTTAGAVVSGAVAVYFKLQADEYYQDYQNTGDEAVLDKVKTNDTISGIALGVCELNLVALTYLLLSR